MTYNLLNEIHLIEPRALPSNLVLVYRPLVSFLAYFLYSSLLLYFI